MNVRQFDIGILFAVGLMGCGNATPSVNTIPSVAPLVADLPSTSVQPGKVISNSIGMQLVEIPAGEFLMGSSDGKYVLFGEQPRHHVTISRPFFIGMHEVTQADYEKVMGSNPSRFRNVANHDTSRFPVERVSWNDAVAFCEALAALPDEKSAGRRYRLPTEAEWEYTCRSGTTTVYYFGNRLSPSEANFNAQQQRTTPVASFEANAFGLFDMHGNVSEWCADWYDSHFYVGSPNKDPLAPQASTPFRSHRGGTWIDHVSADCRSAARGYLDPSHREDFIGFRVVMRQSPSRAE